MLNKKILATAVAVAFSTSAVATIDLDAASSATGTLTLANESFTSASLNSDDQLVVTNLSNALDIVKEVGFTVGQGATRFVRIDLEGGVFNAAPALTTDGDATSPTDFSASISSGGTAGDDFVIFEVNDPTEDILQDDTFTIAAASFAADTGTALTVRYRLFETGAGAVNELDAAELVDSSANMVVFADASTGVYTSADTLTATVASQFKAWELENNIATATVGELGTIDHNLGIATGTFVQASGASFDADDLFSTSSQDITISGDFSFGDFDLGQAGNCGSLEDGTPVINDDEDEAVFTISNITADDYTLCVTLDGTTDVALKGSYEGELATDDLVGALGTIVYDTTTIEVPYVSTFDGVNQRIYIVNDGSSSALYTITFITEDGVEATATAAATGTAAGDEVTMLKVSDLVTLTGGTRAAATIEIEATDADVSASTQIVNRSTGGTDTVVLN